MEEKTFETNFVTIGKDLDSFIESFVGEDIDGTNLGEFFIVIEILNKYEDGEDMAEALTESFRKSFYADKTLDAYSRFEEGLKALNDNARILEADGLILANVNVSIGAKVGNSLFLSQSNDAEIYLVRDGYVTNITEGLSKKGRKRSGEDLFENVATGDVERGDLILFSSARLFRYVSQSEMGKLVFNKDLTESLDILEDALRTEVLGRVGILGLGFIGKADQEANKPIVDDVPVRSRMRFQPNFFSKYLGFLSNRPHFKSYLYYGLASIVAFVVVGYFVITRFVDTPEVKRHREFLAQAYDIVDSAKVETDKEKVREQLDAAAAKANQVMDIRALRGEARRLLTEIQSVRFTHDDVISVTEPVVVIKIDSANILGLDRLNESVFAYGNNDLFEIIAGTVKGPFNLQVGEGKLLDGAAFTEFESLIFYFVDGSIKEYIDGTVSDATITGDAVKGSSIQTFGPRLYILNEDTGQIGRMRRLADTFAAAESYFGQPQVTDATAFAIDSSIYEIDSSGEIHKFYLGELEESFEVTNPPLQSVTSATDMYTAEDVPFVWIFEPSQKRVVQYYKNPNTKDLDYSTQYFFGTLQTVRGFAVDFAAKKLYYADADTVYSVDLRL